MHFLFLGILALALFLLFSRSILNADPRLLARVVRIAGGVSSLALAVVLAITGRWFFAVPLGMFGYSLLMGNRLASPFGYGQRSAGQRSAVRSAYLEMTLDHDTGDMDGRVLAGRFEGAELSHMAESELFALHIDVESDPQSVALLEAYFDRRMPDWRDHASSRSGASSGGGAGGGGAMDREEAFAILGLEPGASDDAIRKAHRTLMKRFHPDQGGSDYLAAKINEAKDILLGEG